MKALTIHLLLAVAFLFAPRSGGAQTTWFKYERNPVLAVGPSGSWDGAGVMPSGIVFDDSLYRMWYCGGSANAGSNWRIGHATSPDGVTWTRSPDTYVLDPGPDAWESLSLILADVTRRNTGYAMWYTGVSSSGYYAIGLATSPDGTVWSKAKTANPVLGQGPWYARGPIAACVMGPDSLGAYKMWFEGDPLAHADFQIGYATALNDTSWTPLEAPVLSFGSPGSWDDDKVMTPAILTDGQTYEMFYCGEQSDGRTQIGYATSPDGITWTRHDANPVLGRGPSEWDLQDLIGIKVLLRKDIYHMWYGGTSQFGSFLWRLGYAVSPKGMSFQISTEDGVVGSMNDTLLLTVRVDDSSGMRFSATVLSQGIPVDTVELFDDGAHEDSLAADGIFANRWTPPATAAYTVDLVLTLSDTLNFGMQSAAAFDIVDGIVDESVVPGRFSLDQNYPNPFNPSTTIRYAIPTRSHVTLTIFNALGQQVATLVQGEQETGYHEAAFDASGLASGLYLYRMHAGDFVQTRRLLLLR